jgi:hypothetical protein
MCFEWLLIRGGKGEFMSLRRRLLTDAIATAPWVAESKNISTSALAFIVFKGGGCPEVVKAGENSQILKQLGSKRVLGWMAENYRGLSNAN